MTREIKFRTWDKSEKKIEYNPRIYWDCANLDDCFYNSGNEKDGHLIWMQFTGLLDKNGKEIYEGDIVRRYSTIALDENHKIKMLEYGEGLPIIAVVKYSSNLGSFVISDTVYNLEGISIYEIIGNIYENPELLGNKNI